MESVTFFLVIVVIAGVGYWWYSRRQVTIKHDLIFERWHYLIEDGSGKSDVVYQTVKNMLERVGENTIKWGMVPVQPGYLKGLMGKKREFLQVTNDKLRAHKLYLGIRDYGTTLAVSWFVTVQPSFLSKRLSNLLMNHPQALSFSLDVFDYEELQNYVSVVHACVKGAVNQLMDDLGQDFSKIDTKSKGVLEVW